MHQRPQNAAAAKLLDFAFFEVDVLASNRVVLLHHHFFGECARIFLGYVEKAGAGGGQQFDLEGGWFGHFETLDLKADDAAEIRIGSAHISYGTLLVNMRCGAPHIVEASCPDSVPAFRSFKPVAVH